MRLKLKEIKIIDLRLILMELEINLNHIELILKSDKTLKIKEMSNRALNSLEEYKNLMLDDINELNRYARQARHYQHIEITKHLDMEILLKRVVKEISVLNNFANNSLEMSEDQILVKETVSIALRELWLIVKLYNDIADMRGWKRLKI